MTIDNMLDRTCTIQKWTKSLDSTTGQMQYTWTNYMTNVPCTKKTLTGDERLISGKESMIATDKFYFKYGLSLSEKSNRIVFDGKTFEILSTGDAAVKRHHLEVKVQVIE